MFINNRILELATPSYYENKSKVYEESFRKKLSENNSNDVIELYPDFPSEIKGSNEEDIAIKASKILIDFRAKEKALFTLMREGIIMPVRMCSGDFSKSITYNYSNCEIETDVQFNRIVFSAFMKV